MNNKLKFSGLAIFLLGFIIFILNPVANFTGFAISEIIGKNSTSVYVVGLVLMGVGVGVMMSGSESTREKEKAKLERIIEGGGIGSYADLRRSARKLGYRLEEGPKHTEVYEDDRKITEIPRHRESKKGTYRAILRALYEAA